MKDYSTTTVLLQANQNRTLRKQLSRSLYFDRYRNTCLVFGLLLRDAHEHEPNALLIDLLIRQLFEILK